MSRLHSESREAPTLQDLARAAGVSRTTASNAFNRPDQLSPALRERVLAVAQELGYAGPNPAARMLRTGRCGAVGLVFCGSLTYTFRDPTAIAFLQGVAEGCEAEGVGLLLLPQQRGPSERSLVIETAAVDGFIVYSMPRRHPLVRRLAERRLPMVAVDQPSIEGAPSVLVRDREGARAAARHLLELGHRHLAALSFELTPEARAAWADPRRRARTRYDVAEQRLGGYADALADHGLPAEALSVHEAADNTRAHARQAMDAILAREPRPTAILAMSDELALGAVEEARRRGLRVPDDLSVVGFDDSPAAAAARPPLTTVRQPIVEKGRLAARLLLERADAGRSAQLPAELVVRGSTAPPEDGD